MWRAGQYALSRLEAIASRQVQVHQNNIGLYLHRLRLRLEAIAGLRYHLHIALSFDHFPYHATNQRMIIDYHYPYHLHSPRESPGPLTTSYYVKRIWVNRCRYIHTLHYTDLFKKQAVIQSRFAGLVIYRYQLNPTQ